MTAAVVSGALFDKPGNGGNAWTRMCWAVGLRRLGFDVYFVDEHKGFGSSGVPGQGAAAQAGGRNWFETVTERFGLAGSAALLEPDGGPGLGLTRSDLLDAAGGGLLVNISGHLTDVEMKRRFRHTVYIDDDPGFTQFWAAAGHLGTRLEGHDLHLTVGGNIGDPDCPIPTVDVMWHPTAPPVVLDNWPMADPVGFDRFTTVGTWRGPYGPLTVDGVTYGLKVHEFRRFIELPGRVAAPFEVALDMHAADERDRDRLCREGWHVRDPSEVAGTPDLFRGYLASSGAEFSAAQGMYVQTRSGWFSDRTARYLASGRPALVQDTGLSRRYPVGEGLLTFRTIEEAAAGAEAILADHEHHCRAARALAETFFDSDRVIGRVVERLGATP